MGADPEESGGLGPSSWAARSEKMGGISIQSKRAALRLVQHFGCSNRASSRRLVGSRSRGVATDLCRHHVTDRRATGIARASLRGQRGANPADDEGRGVP